MSYSGKYLCQRNRYMRPFLNAWSPMNQPTASFADGTVVLYFYLSLIVRIVFFFW